MVVTDPVLLARQVDGTLVVADAGNTRRAVLARAFDALRGRQRAFAGCGAQPHLDFPLRLLFVRLSVLLFQRRSAQETFPPQSFLGRRFSRNGHSAHGADAAATSDERADPASKG